MMNRRGQTTSEYMGLLLLVGLTIAALVSSDVPGAVARGVERQVCRIAAQARCEPAPRSSRPIFVGRLLGAGKRAWEAAKQRAKPLGIAPGLLLAAEKVARVRARELQNLLPKIQRERFNTMAVGVGRDSGGRLRVIVGVNNPDGKLPTAIRGAIKPGEQVATLMGDGHAEEQILRWMTANNLKPITVGAGRPICPRCADAIARSGATAASKLK